MQSTLKAANRADLLKNFGRNWIFDKKLTQIYNLTIKAI